MADVPDDLTEYIAQAADAWLSDPADVAAYARLVAAVHARRAHLAAGAVDRPGFAPAPDPVGGDDVPTDRPTDVPTGAAEEVPDDASQVRPVGAELDGDPRAVLHRLRTGLR